MKWWQLCCLPGVSFLASSCSSLFEMVETAKAIRGLALI